MRSERGQSTLNAALERSGLKAGKIITKSGRGSRNWPECSGLMVMLLTPLSRPNSCSAPHFSGDSMTNLDAPIDAVVGFYRQRAGAENLIKEANNDAGLAAHPSARWAMNCVHFQLAMLAYNLNCWLMLFNREEQTKTEDLRHTTLATARWRFLFLAAKIVRHAGAVLVRYSDHYAEQGTMGRLMDRLRAIVPDGNRFAPVLASALRL